MGLINLEPGGRRGFPVHFPFWVFLANNRPSPLSFTGGTRLCVRFFGLFSCFLRQAHDPLLSPISGRPFVFFFSVLSKGFPRVRFFFERTSFPTKTSFRRVVPPHMFIFFGGLPDFMVLFPVACV